MEITRQSSSKHGKFSDGDRNMPSTDRFSSLPDGVICHILSFLPTKLSVSTSILSRRWRFLWTYVSNLDFDIRNHNSRTSFPSIVHRVMFLRRVQNVISFRLLYRGLNCSAYDIKTWISTVVVRNVRNLDLHLDDWIVFMLPQCIDTCRTLVNLRLQFCALPPCNGAVFLPSLKMLYLYHIEYVVEETLPQLLSGCPVLEELIIEKVLDDDLSCLNISSHTIKRLTVEFPIDFDDLVYLDHRVNINAPELRYLEVFDFSFEHISFLPANSLIKADIYLNRDEVKVGYNLYTRCLLKFIDSLCSVKCLNLFGCHEMNLEFPVDRSILMQNLEFPVDGSIVMQNLEFPVIGSNVKFDNLTKLELDGDWRFLSYLLGNADNLQVLIIRNVDSDLKCWTEPDQVPKCLSHLRTICIHQECTEVEFELIRYFLKNAKVLERMEIYSNHKIDLKEEFDPIERISSFHRGSVDCTLVFH